MTTTATITEQLTVAAEIAGGKAWGADKGKPRIYMTSSRDRKVYIDFPDATADDLGGAVVKVTVDDCGQSPKWYASQKQREIDGVREAFFAVTWYLFTGNVEEAEQIIDDELSVSDEAASHIADGREPEARQAIGF